MTTNTLTFDEYKTKPQQLRTKLAEHGFQVRMPNGDLATCGEADACIKDTSLLDYYQPAKQNTGIDLSVTAKPTDSESDGTDTPWSDVTDDYEDTDDTNTNSLTKSGVYMNVYVDGEQLTVQNLDTEFLQFLFREGKKTDTRNTVRDSIVTTINKHGIQAVNDRIDELNITIRFARKGERSTRKTRDLLA